MIAALPMYDRPETAAAHDRLWSLVRAALPPGRAAPLGLSRGGDVWAQWRAPDLLLSQTCGYPYRARLHGHVALVATPVWALPCPPGHYVSVLVVRRDDPRRDLADYAAACLAYNEPLSQSGWAAPYAHAAARGLRFAHVLHTGSHRAASRAVAEGRADIAALDMVSWHLIRRFDPWAEALRVVEETEPTPALPYIAAPALAEGVADALAAGIAALSAEDRALLLLQGIALIPAEAYLGVPTPPDPQASAAEAG